MEKPSKLKKNVKKPLFSEVILERTEGDIERRGPLPCPRPRRGRGDGGAFDKTSGTFRGRGSYQVTGGERGSPRTAPGKRGGGRGEFFLTVQWFSMAGIEK